MALTRKGTLFCLVLFCIFIAKAWIPDSRTFDLTETKKKTLKQIMNDGISSLRGIVTAIELYNSSECQFQKYCETTIFPLSTTMESNFSSLKNIMKSYIKDINDETASMMKDLKYEQDKENNLSTTIKIFVLDIEKMKKDEIDASNRLEEADKELKNARINVISAEKELKNAKDNDKVGFVLCSFTTIFTMGLLTPVAAAISTVASAIIYVSLQETLATCKNIEWHADNVYKIHLNRKNQLLDDLQISKQELQVTEKNMKEVKRKLEHIILTIRHLQSEYKDAVKSQEIMRKMVQAVSKVNTVAKILHFESDGSCTLEQMIDYITQLLEYLSHLSHQPVFLDILSAADIRLLQNRVLSKKGKYKNENLSCEFNN